MRRRSMTPHLALALLTLAWPGFAPPAAAGPRDGDSTGSDDPVALPAGLLEAHAALSRSMREADMRGFMDMFHLDFIYEAADTSSLDRGPWRRLWLERFGEIHYERVVFEPQHVLRSEDGRMVLRTRRVLVAEDLDGGSRRLDDTIFEDTWLEENGGWTLRYRKEIATRTAGTIASDAGRITSPRLAALARALGAGEEKSLAAFWEEIEREGTPLIEPIPGDDTSSRVTFIWRAPREEGEILVRGGLPSRRGVKPLEQLGDSDVWYRTERLPGNASFTYEFHVEKPVRVPAGGGEPAAKFLVGFTSSDRLNPRSIGGKSLAALPAAPALPWLESVEGRPSGEVERQTIRSGILGERRFVTVYTPPGYDSTGSRYPAVLLVDGGNYDSRRQTGVVLDNLVATKKIPPVVVFMIHDEGSRSRELELTADLERFVVEEVLTFARQEYHISEKPEDVVMGGAGPGAALAAYCATDHPEVFPRVLSGSGDFSLPLKSADGGEGLTLPRRLSETPSRPVGFFLAVGTLEGDPVLSSNRHLRDVLVARGYRTTWVELPANHHALSWYRTLAGGLAHFLSR